MALNIPYPGRDMTLLNPGAPTVAGDPKPHSRAVYRSAFEAAIGKGMHVIRRDLAAYDLSPPGVRLRTGHGRKGMRFVGSVQ